MMFQLLGPVQLDGRPLRSATVRALLALLLLDAGQVVSYQQLIEGLWDEPPPSARQNLRSYSTELRRLLAPGHELITYRGGGYLLEIGPDELDAAVFTGLVRQARGHHAQGKSRVAAAELSRALDLWAGPAGVDARGSAMLRMRLQALDEQRWTARESHIEMRMRLGECHAVLADLHELTARQPLRERSWSLLMRACYLSGDASTALGAYQRLRGALRDQLGVGPSENLQKLHIAVLRDDYPVIALSR
ncbi:MAG: AfsR/SARP family transcriptional regulator [Jatrophihabitantaceae bacterium]